MHQTIGERQTLQYNNVISTFFEVQPNQISQTFESFLTTIFDAHYSANGPFFYCINSDVSGDGNILLQTFLPVKEDHINELPSDYIYQTYFQVLNMVAVRAFGDSEVVISESFQHLFHYINKIQLKVRTPVFYLVTVDESDIYTDLLVGVGSD